MATPLRMVGRTTDDAPVMAGVGLMMTTHGVPLEIVLAGFKERGWVCDWVDYCATCVKDGHNEETIRSRIVAACGDVYGRPYAEEVRVRVETLFTLPAFSRRS